MDNSYTGFVLMIIAMFIFLNITNYEYQCDTTHKDEYVQEEKCYINKREEE